MTQLKTVKLNQLQKTIKIKFKQPEHLKQALIHRSYLNESRGKNCQSNERYEFLGDAVLELWTSQTLFHRFPHFPEGKLTNLRSLVVCTQNLSQIAQQIKLGNFLFLSKGEEANLGRQNRSILADSLEAVIGAIFLDQGMKGAQKFLNHFLLPSLVKLSTKKIYKDPKSLFQELAQAQRGITPEYRTLAESGPDHQKNFKVGVFLGKELIAAGTGPSKQTAAESASLLAFKKLKKQV